MQFRGVNHLSLSVTDLDHSGLTADSRDELEEWVVRFEAAGVAYSPIRDMPFGYHLNFRDPDGIPLELHAHNEIARQGHADLRVRDVAPDEIDPRIRAVLEAAEAGGRMLRQ